ncbi:hypothetical protein JOC54_002342 [Alkalihalobacillus xiaoxiensis]|uniref:Uncharacterized protein n=1 Tax=Shouchella xiaoxiensis TaxID=766895 RepID=A0ABS2SU76_9BACI|nr:hypothetical protein [Shouchella xiaoxiensis]
MATQMEQHPPTGSRLTFVLKNQYHKNIPLKNALL